MKEGIRSKIIDTDEHPRPDSTAEQLASLKPVFDAEGVVTAGRMTLVNVLLCTHVVVRTLNWSIFRAS